MFNLYVPGAIFGTTINWTLPWEWSISTLGWPPESRLGWARGFNFNLNLIQPASEQNDHLSCADQSLLSRANFEVQVTEYVSLIHLGRPQGFEYKLVPWYKFGCHPRYEFCVCDLSIYLKSRSLRWASKVPRRQECCKQHI